MRLDGITISTLLDPRKAWGRWLLVLGVSAVYLGAAELNLTMAAAPDPVRVVWPPGGIALAAVLFFGPRVWPGIALGAFLVCAGAGTPAAAAVGVAAGNTLDAVSGAWLLRRFIGFDPSLERLKDVLGLIVLAAGLGTMVGATISIAGLCLAGVRPWGSFGLLWWVWWLGDMTSDLVVAPLILTLMTRLRSHRPRRLGLEAVMLGAALSLVTLVVFGGAARGGIANGLAYSVFPFIIWAALRLGPLGSGAVAAFSSAVAIWGTARGLGPFAREDLDESLMLIRLFMNVVAITGMLLAAAVAQSRRAGRRASAQYAAARILAESWTREVALRPILDCVRVELEWDVVALWIAQGSEESLRLVEFSSDPACSFPRFEAACRAHRFARGQGIPGRVWATARSSWHGDVRDERDYPRISAGAAEGLLGALAVPIVLGGEVFGVMEFFRRESRPPDEDLLETTASIGRLIGQFLERRSAEEALSRNRETLALAQEAAQVSAFVWDIGPGGGTARHPGDPVREVTAGIEGMTGLWREAVHPEDRDRVEAEVNGAASQLQPLDTEFRIVLPCGEVRWIAARGRVLLDEQGRPARMVGINIDFTEKKLAGDALRRSEEKYRAFIQQSSEGIWCAELAEPIATDRSEDEQIEDIYRISSLGECNDAMARMYGFSCAAEMVGMRLDQLLPRSDPYNIDYIRRFIRGGYRLDDEESHEIDRYGVAKCFMNNLVGIVEQGRLVRAWGTQRDVTEQRRVERELRESEEFRRRILESTQDCVIVLTLHGSFLSMNDAGLASLEIDEMGELIGASWPDVWPAEGRDAACVAIAAAAAGGVGRFQGLLPTRRSGTPRWWDVVVTPILDSGQMPNYLLAVLRDVTDQKTMEAALRETDRRKDEFLAMLAHELRNPLSAISSAAELASQPGLSAEDAWWSQKVISRQVHHLSRLIDDLLDISRITCGTVRLRIEPFDARAVIAQAVDSVRPLIAERGHQLEVSEIPSPLWLVGDPTRIEQVMVNLLTNAAKYTDSGGTIWVSASRAADEVIIEVRDNGIGIPPERLAEVFELFSQGDRSLARSEGGLGIGLTLVKRLTELHGGRVVALSDGPGKGSEFVVRLPSAPGREEPAPCAAEGSEQGRRLCVSS